ncbi:hypothetical protein D9615_005298 [Tricholomella constricta]|uniref:DUF6697 domain-containing protein n=1 Tax=Tricholomella constricta TaxID=117010 RepID=A0A8H5H6N9_9AGAR|nr:hypothetical protein D9615_005298 [Tricholomella constricta]
MSSPTRRHDRNLIYYSNSSVTTTEKFIEMEGFQGPRPDMDEAFWASVVKRWSDACDSVVSLKQELKKAKVESYKHQEQLHALKVREETLLRERNRLQEESEEYRDRSLTLLKEKEAFVLSQTRPLAPALVGTRVPGEITLNKLREAEEGLEKAKHEFGKLKDQSSKLSEQNRAMREEIGSLQQAKEATEENNRILTEENIRAATELTDSRLECNMWTERLQELRSQTQESKVAFEAQHRELSGEIERLRQLASQRDVITGQFALQSKEILTLRAAAAADKEEINTFRVQLTSTREKLMEASDKNKTLLDNFTRLNEKLRDPAFTHPPSQPLHNPSSIPPKEEQSPVELDSQGGVSTYRRTGSRIFIRPPTSPSTSNKAFTNKATPSQSTMQTLSTCATPSFIPDARQRSLAELVHYIPDFDREDCRFRRAVLACAIGGNIQSLIVRVTHSATEIAKARNISTYLCPALDLNPWCPTSPGQHGYIFVGLGQEHNTFQEPQAGLHVFVGQSRSRSRPKEYQYLGVYTAVRVASLSAEEWHTLSREVAYGYASMTKDKNKDARSVEEILAAYDTGQLSAPCVRLQCTDFDENLYTALVAAQTEPLPARQSRAVGKRRREDREEHHPRPRRAARSRSPYEPGDESGF